MALSIPRGSASNYPNNFAFSPGGETLVVGDGKIIRRWTLATGEEAQPSCLVGYDRPTTIHEVSFSPNGKFIVGGYQSAFDNGYNNASVFDAKTGSNTSFARLQPGVTLLGFRSDGTFAAWTANGQVETFQPEHESIHARELRTSGISGPKQAMPCFSPNARVLACSHHGNIDLWVAASG